MLTVAISVIDVLGTLAFALSGALLGVRKRFDLFGILFLSFVAGITGGLMRDVLIGALPPAAIANVHYSLIAIAAGLITFFWYRSVAAWARLILLVDAVGLAMFAVAGAQKAIEFGINPPMAALLGMLTGIGGVSRIYTDVAVIDVTPNGLVAAQWVEGLSFDELRAMTGAPLARAPAEAEP